MSQVRAKRARRWRLFNRAIARLRASWAPKPVTFDMLEQRRMLSSTLSIGNVALIEPANGIAAASFPLSLSEASATDVTVKYKTISGSAKAGKDFVATSGSLVIPAGTLSENLNISIIGGVSGNTTKQFLVKVVKATNASIANNTATGSITDNITPSLSVQSATTTEGKKHSLKLAVLLSGKSTSPVTVHWATADGGALAGIDYAASQGDLTFKPGQTLKKISVPIIGKATPINTETFNVNLSNPTNATVGTNGVETIVGTNGLNQIYIDDETITRPASGYKDLNFKVHLLNPSDGTVSVQYATLPGTAAEGQYVSVAGTVEFLNGQTTTNISVPIVGTTFYNPHITFFVQLSNPVDAEIADSEATGTIISNSAPPQIPPPIASVNSISANEGDSGDTPFTFNVTLSAPSAKPVVVFYQTQDGTAISGTDYIGGAGAVYFPAGATTEPVTVDVLGNTTLSPDKTFDLVLTGATNAYVSTTPGVATIVNDDFPTLSVSDTVASATNEGTNTIAVFTVSLSEATDVPVTADYFTSDGTATVADGDYDALSGSLDFAPGETNKTISVTVNGKGTADIGDTFFLNLSDVSASAILGTTKGTATIIQAPAISVGDVTVDESGSGGRDATFTVSLSNATTQTVTVHYATADATAHAGTNYTSETGTLTFQAGGALSQTVTIPVASNIEDGETFTLNLSSPTNATISDAQATALLTNPPRVSVSDPSIPSTTSGTSTVNFTVSLSAPSLRPITVHYNTQDDTATQPSDYQSTTGSLIFSPGTTSMNVPVTVFTSPTIPDGAEFFLDLTSPTIATLGTSSAAATFVNTPAISVGDISVPVNNSNATADFVISLSNPSERTVTVHYVTQDGSATAPGDYTAASGMVTFPAGTTTEHVPVTVTTNGDDGSQFFLDLSLPLNATLTTTQASASIVRPPVISVSDASQLEGDSGTTPMQFTVTLSHASLNSVSFDYFTSDDTGTASAGDDYESTSGSVDIAPGQTTATIDVNIIGDTLAETDEDFFLNFTNPQNGTLDSSVATGTILNDDGGGISINNVIAPESDQNFVPTEAIFTITLSTPYVDPVDVQYNTVDDSAIGGIDFTSTSGGFEFAPGETQKIVTVPLIDAFNSSGTPDFFLELTSVSPGVLVDQGSGEATIIENDPLPNIQVDQATVEESSDPNSQQPMQFTVSVFGAHALPVTLDYNTSDDSASGGIDYTTTTGSLTFAPTTDSGTVQQTISVPIIGGNDPLSTSDFVMNLTNIQNANDFGDTAFGFIEDDNVAPTVSIQSSNSMTENDQSNGGNLSFDVSLSHSYTQDVTVQYTTQDDSASGGVDYTPTNGVLTIPAGETDGTIEVPIINNTIVDGDRDFEVVLSNPTNATIDNSTGTGTIIDDDAVPQAYVTTSPVQEGDFGTTDDFFFINLTSAYNNPVTVDYSTSDGTAFGNPDSPTSDYQSTSDSVTFEPGQTSKSVSVEINGNTIEQPDRNFHFNISSSDVTVQDSGTVLGIIQDDDAPVVDVSNPSLIEPPSGQTQNMEFTVSLEKPLSYPVSVDYFTSGGQDEYASTSGSLDFEAGQTSMTIDVPVSGGFDLEGNDQFSLNVVVHDPLNGDFDTSGTATVYATNDPSQTDLSINNPILSPVNADTSSLSFDVFNNGPQASGNYTIKFYAIAYNGSGGGDRFQIEAFDPDTNQLLSSIDPIGPGGDVGYTVDPLMVDVNGNPIPAGYYSVKIVICTSGSGVLACNTTPNELPYTHTQVLWTGSGDGDEWSDPANWNTDAVPGMGDDVIINNGQGQPIFYDDINTEINSLFSSTTLFLDSGSLMVDTTAQVDAGFLLNGGELDNATILPGSDGEGLELTDQGGTLKNIIADADIDGDESEDGASVDFLDSLQLNGTFYAGDEFDPISASFDTDNSACFNITGDGTIELDGLMSNLYNDASMLNIGSGVTIAGELGTITNVDGGYVLNRGTISADSLDIEGNLVNDGLISPAGMGNTGSLFVDGDFTQRSGGSFYADLDIGEGAFDNIQVSGQANLDGILEYALSHAANPPTGATFDVIQADSINGTFDNPPTNAGTNLNYSFSAAYLGTIVELTADFIGPQTFFVDANNTGASNPDGLSWSGAFDDLQQALNSPSLRAGDTIEVAGGVYTPGSDQDDSFVIPDGVTVEGGFAGSAIPGEPDTRDLTAFTSFLSGDIGTPHVSSDNIYHVVTADYTYSNTRLDGFTIEYGHSYSYGGGLTASYSDITIANCTFIDNDAAGGGGAIYFFESSPTIVSSEFDDNEAGFAGGAIFIDTGSDPDISNSNFTDNSAEVLGGAIYSNDAYGQINHCIFQGNLADSGGAIAAEGSNFSISNSAFVQNVAYGYYGESISGGRGGAIAVDESELTVASSTFTANYAAPVSDDDGDYYGGYGAGIAAHESAVTVTNSILWNDTAAYTPEIYAGDGTTVTVTYSDIEDATYGSEATNIDADPLFLRAPGTDSPTDLGDLHLGEGSPAINAGNDSVGGTAGTDLAGNSRVENGEIDLGSYETQIIYVDAGATGANDGTSWQDAFTDLQDGLGAAHVDNVVEVAGGTYHPTSDTEQDISFLLPIDAGVYGGFAGSNASGTPGARDTAMYPTILSGDLGGGVHSYHVVQTYVPDDGTTLTSLTRLDGFTITAGQTGNGNSGGGLSITEGSPTIANCIFTGNTSDFAGGAVGIDQATPTIIDCIFTDNTAPYGGALSCDSEAGGLVTGCTFTDNAAVGQFGDGGAIYLEDSGLVVQDSKFYANSAAFDGGAILGVDFSINLTNCVFVGNTAIGDSSGPGYGGAIYDQDGLLTVTNSTFTANFAQGTENNGTYYGGYGGAIAASENAEVHITNSILWNNSAANYSEVYYDFSASATITYTDIQDGFLSDGTGDIDAAPAFVRSPNPGQDNVWGTSDDDFGDLRLIIGSPGIDSGNNDDVPSGVTTDLAGVPRIINAADTSDTADATVDMGAYETDPVYVDAALGSSVRIGPDFAVQPAQDDAAGASWASANPDLSDALSHATAGQMLFIAEGFYVPDDTGTFNIPTGVSLFGGYEGSTGGSADARDVQTTLEGELTAGGNALHVVTMVNPDARNVLDGLTIRDGDASAVSGIDGSGGAVLIENGDPYFNGIDFTGDTAEINGGDIYDDGSALTITNSIFTGGDATYGGSIFVDGGSLLVSDTSFTDSGAAVGGGAIAANNSPVTLIGDTFSHDTGVSGNSSTGGALYLQGTSTAQVVNSSFDNDEADNGGAIFASAGTGLTVTDSTFDTDSTSGDAGESGGAIYAVQASVDIEQSNFAGNSADAGGAVSLQQVSGATFNSDIFNDNHAGFIAGAIDFNGSTATVSNSLFTLNHATNAGAIEEGGSTVTVINSTFSGNSGGGNATLELIESTVNAENSIFYGDIGGEFSNHFEGTFNVSHSDIQGGFAGTGNLDIDPQFIRNPGTNSASDPGDLELQANSPLIDAGDNSFVTTSTDLNGNLRIANQVVDIGAYEQQVIFVDANLVGGTDDGSSWANAFTSLTDALDAVHAGERIDVAGGIYTPSTSGDEDASFVLSEDGAIYGGYAGSADAGNPYQRNFTTFTSILSGDVGNDNKAYHVVYADNANGTRLDGFTISNGSAYGSGGSDQYGGGIHVNNSVLTIANCTFTNNSGYYGGAISENASTLTISGSSFSNNSAYDGGAILMDNSTLTITNSSFSSNSEDDSDSSGNGGAIATSVSTLNLLNDTFDSNTASFGGAIAAEATTINVTNTLFTNNTATGFRGEENYFGGYGGAIYLYVNSHLTATNCTFSANTAQNYDSSDEGTYFGYGGAISASDSHVVVTNSILWGDSADNGQEIFAASDSTLSVTDTDIQDSDLSTGTGDIDADPQFLSGGFQLTYSSPAIDAGNNLAVPYGVTTDLAGNTRITNGAVDMGAYEFQNFIFVDAAATGINNGTSWGDAFTSLADGAGAGFSRNARVEISAGTYTPGTSRSSFFQLSDEGLYGGYGGAVNNPNPGVRNVALYDTILSGDVSNTPGDNTDNAYHVIVTDDPSTLDGLSITGGYANGVGGSFVNNSYGGAIFDQFFVTINNCTIADNFASEFGGGIFVNPARTAIITNTTFEDNSAQLGGAIATQYHGTLTITGSTFITNQSQIAGGAIWAQGDASISNSVFDNNNGGSNGGGAIGAQSTNLGGPLIHPNISLVNDVFDDNSTAGNGGGFYNTGANLTIINATFTANSAGGNGGALFGAADQVVNSILWNDNDSNGNTEEFGADPSKFGNDDIEGGLSGGFDINNIDPQFVAAPTSGTDGIFHTSDDTYGNLSLQATSPLIDQGDNSAVPNGDPLDIAGNPRISGGAIDLGAYEFQENVLFVDPGASGTADGSSWADAFQTLTAALGHAGSGVRIDIAGATYYPTLLADPTMDSTRSDSFVIPDGVSLFGGYAGSASDDPYTRDLIAYTTILTGDIGTSGDNSDNVYHVITLSNDGSSTLLDGLTITDGNADGIATADTEGGAALLTSSSPTFSNCIFSDSTAANGGAIYDSNAALNLSNCSFTGDSATGGGGGIYLTNVIGDITDCSFSNDSSSAGGALAAYANSNVTMSGGTFSSNTASIVGGGIYSKSTTWSVNGTTFSSNSGPTNAGNDGAGAMYLTTSSTGTFTSCTFNDNTAGYYGGAVSVAGGSTPTFTNCNFTGNSAAVRGGAVYNLNSSPTFIGCNFVQNTASTASGGGLYSESQSGKTVVLSLVSCKFEGNAAADGAGLDETADSGGTSSVTVVNCLFVGNVAATTDPTRGYGGAAGVITPATAAFINSTFVDNQAETYGGALESTSSVTFTNCIIWNNTAGTDGNNLYNGGGTLEIDYSDFNAGTGGSAYTGAGNIDSDPLFIQDPSPGIDGVWGTSDDDYGNLQLQSGSLAIDSGNNAGVPSGITTDLAGNARIIDGVVDMGAYESAAIPAIYVDASATGNDDGSTWANAYTTLTEALANDLALERIDIAGGTYYPTSGSDRTVSFVIPDGLSIYGGYAGTINPGYRSVSTYVTILSGDIGTEGSTADNSYNLVTFNGTGSSSVLDGITISAGNADGNSSTFYEGGGLLINSGSLTINDCTFSNDLGSGGAAVYTHSSGAITFTNCDFSNNTAITLAGAIDNYSSAMTITDCSFTDNSVTGNGMPSNSSAGAINSYGALTITGSTFTGNSAYLAGTIYFDATNPADALTLSSDTFTSNSSGGGGGGAFYVQYSTANVTDCTFTSNSDSGLGGAIRDYSATLSITGCTFTTNIAGPLVGSAGGAIENYGANAGDPITITDCIFDGNTATEYGGAIANYAGAIPTLVNCLFSLNTAGISGSTPGEGGAVFTNGSSPTFINCTFANNTAFDPVIQAGMGGAMYVTGSGTTTISNSILWNDVAVGNSAEDEIDNAGATVNVDHTDFSGGDTVNGNSGADPLFVRNPGTNGDTDYGDLHLQDGSPAIANGDASEVPGSVTTDLDGNPRTQDGDVDMGAYESTPS